MKSYSAISDQENYQDNVEEFLGIIMEKKVKNQKFGTGIQMDDSYNPCDETMGYIQIVDEYENVDKFKRVPRHSEPNQQKDRRVNLPNFSVKLNPFLKNELNGSYRQEAQAVPVTKGGEPNGYYQNGKQNVQQPVIKIQISAENNSNNEFYQNNQILDDNQNGKNNYNAAQDSRYEDSINEGNVENEIINQIADQIPELLDRSEMRDMCLTPSIVQGLKQQNQKEKKSEFAKAIDPHYNDRNGDEEEDVAIQLNKVDAKSQLIASNHDLLQRQLEVQQKLQREKEELEQMQLMEGYESDPPLPREDENVIYTLVKKEFEFHKKKISKQMIYDLMRDYKYIQAKDECRAEPSHKDGGKECKDKKIKQCLRGIGKEIISQVGRKIISGKFNLTEISFPIRAMIPKSALEKALYSTCLFPLYINKAVQTTDLVERFKFLICATLGNFYINCGFLKPLNPIIGETCQGFYPDGTRLYAEQISHHPPISYFTIYGPDKSYMMYGNYNYKSNAGLNSLTLKNKGTRHIRFKDGQFISYNFAKEVYSGSFMGAMKVESKGQITFKDEVNKLVAEISIDSVKRRPTDFISGTIKVKDQVVSKCYGSYMGFIEFDDIRYWDYRYILPYEPIIMKSSLGSDQSQRPDKLFLQMGEIPQAQKKKEELEELQRSDAKLRKKFETEKQKKIQKDQKDQKKKK